MNIEILQVKNNKDLKKFIKFPWKIYINDKNWVPPLISEVKKHLDKKKNPFFEHAEAEYFLAFKNGKLAGRIAAVINHRHNEFHNENTGFFGFFECIKDQDTANVLFDTVKKMLKERNLDVIRGPMNFSTNDECGLLIDGFDKPPVIMMTHNPPYYKELIENYGFKKAMDLYAYYIDNPKPPDKLKRGAELIKKRKKILIRSLNMKRFNEEIETIKQLYNSAWEKNWGFVPFTENEINHMADSLKSIVDSHLVLIAEIEGEPIGFSLTLPNINQALRKINGKLFPFGLIKLLYYFRKINEVRVLLMGVKKKYRKIGIDTLFIYETFKIGTGKGYNRGEMSWILENNLVMNNIMINLGAKRYKTYRIFDYNL